MRHGAHDSRCLLFCHDSCQCKGANVDANNGMTWLQQSKRKKQLNARAWMPMAPFIDNIMNDVAMQNDNATGGDESSKNKKKEAESTKMLTNSCKRALRHAGGLSSIDQPSSGAFCFASKCGLD
jgi:hypothetical protein